MTLTEEQIPVRMRRRERGWVHRAVAALCAEAARSADTPVLAQA